MKQPDEIYVRAYTQKPEKEPVANFHRPKRDVGASDYTLIFDTETNTDAAQQLRLGFYQVRKSDRLRKEGIFIDAHSLSEFEIALIRAFADKHGLELISAEEFRDRIFLKYAYHLRALVVGFNLPFDISRIAFSHNSARGSMRGGFSFALTSRKTDPRVRVKHLSASAALIDFSEPGKQPDGRAARQRGDASPPCRGYFVDLKTLASALLSRKHSLASLARQLDTPTQKHLTDKHGSTLTEDYLNYARTDVQTTWECFQALRARYGEHGLDKAVHRILSEASLGKAYLETMGVQPLLALQPNFPRAQFGEIMSSYYGGRAEAHIRRVVQCVLYADFKSMYPTVNALMGLWSFVIAKNFERIDSTEETQAFLDAIKPEDLQSKETWRELTTLVQLAPDHDLLPVRAQYTENKDNLTIGLNHLTCATPLWYTLADCVASKMLTGKTPRILQAYRFQAGPKQSGLKPVKLMGRADFEIDPNGDDVFSRFIDLRDEAKSRKDPIEKALKIIANSTCYGIFVEVNRDNAPKPEPLNVFGLDTEFTIDSTALEEPGRYFHPLLATLITGAARLMLALAERAALSEGLDWAFCDTDSIAMAKPDSITESDFIARAQRVVDWFAPLNPYRKAGSILKIEDANFNCETGELSPLNCLAISAKRYALFNVDANGLPILRKASAHGLGHLLPPYGEDAPAADIPGSTLPLSEIGVNRWQYDLWFQLISAALSGDVDRVRYDYHPALAQPALIRYGGTSPALLDWMKQFNSHKPYNQQVRPFGFMVGFMPRTGPFAVFEDGKIVETIDRGRPKTGRVVKPVAPFERSPSKAIEMAFDRETGEQVSAIRLKTYAETLALYHRSPEDKFKHAGPADKGATQRRHIRADQVRLIGKEANKVGEAGETHAAERIVAMLCQRGSAQAAAIQVEAI